MPKSQSTQKFCPLQRKGFDYFPNRAVLHNQNIAKSQSHTQKAKLQMQFSNNQPVKISAENNKLTLQLKYHRQTGE